MVRTRYFPLPGLGLISGWGTKIPKLGGKKQNKKLKVRVTSLKVTSSYCSLWPPKHLLRFTKAGWQKREAKASIWRLFLSLIRCVTLHIHSASVLQLSSKNLAITAEIPVRVLWGLTGRYYPVRVFVRVNWRYYLEIPSFCPWTPLRKHRSLPRLHCRHV